MRKMLLSFIVVLAFFSCEYIESGSQAEQNNLNFQLDLSTASKSLADYGKSITSVEVIVSNDDVAYGPENLSYDETTEVTTGSITGILPGTYDVEIRGYFSNGDTVEQVLKGSEYGIEVLSGNTTLVNLNLSIIINGEVTSLPDTGSISITGSVVNTEHITTINVTKHHWVNSVVFEEPMPNIPDDIGFTTWTSSVGFDHTIQNVNPGDVLVFKINLVDQLSVSENIIPENIHLEIRGSSENILGSLQSTVSNFVSTGTLSFNITNAGFYSSEDYNSLDGFWISLDTPLTPSVGQTIESFTISLVVPSEFPGSSPIPEGQNIHFNSLRLSAAAEGDLTSEPFPLIF